jgi:hypothetical protein
VEKYTIHNWILDAKSELNGYGFPFNREHLIFYKRLKTASSIVENLSAKKKKDRYIIKLNRVLGRALNDKNLKTIVGRMEKKTQIFDELRNVMRIAASGGKKGLNDDGEDVDIKTIEEAVTIFRNSDKIKAAPVANIDYNKMVKQIDKYWEKFFADPIMVTTASGETILVQPGYVKSTVRRKPLKLIYYEACLNEADARARERYLKSGAGKRYLRNRLRSHLENL